MRPRIVIELFDECDRSVLFLASTPREGSTRCWTHARHEAMELRSMARARRIRALFSWLQDYELSLVHENPRPARLAGAAFED